MDRPRIAGDVAVDESWQLQGTDYVFFAFLALMFIEYTGLAYLFPPLQILRVPTLLAWGVAFTVYARVGTRVVADYTQNKLLAIFVVFSAFSVAWAVVQSPAATAFRAHLDYFGLFAAALYLIDRKARIDQLTLLFSLVPIMMAVRNADKLTSPLRTGAMNGAYFTGDGNDFAWAMCTMIPLCMYPLLTKGTKWRRAAGAVGMLACLFGVVGSQSRGAALAVAAMLVYYFFRIARRRAVMLSMVVLVAVAFSTLAPSYYMDRLETIESFEEDESANSRLRMWGFAIRMAADFPLGVGAGNFSQAYGLIYLPNEDAGYGWGANRWLNAHSVYFKALGEGGVLGLGLILTLIAVNLKTNEATNRRIRAVQGAGPQPGRIADVWPSLLNMSLVAYGVGGLFLGGLTYPHLYLLSGLAAGARRYADHLVQTDSSAPAAAASVPVAEALPAGALVNPAALARCRERRRAS